MARKGTKKYHECWWYRHEYDDWGQYHICELPDMREFGPPNECKCKGVLERNKCQHFMKHPTDVVFLKNNERN